MKYSSAAMVPVPHAFEATLDFQWFIEEAYAQAGYDLVEIPRAPLLDRVAFVNRFIEAVRAARPSEPVTPR